MSQEVIYQILKNSDAEWPDDDEVWDTTYAILDALDYKDEQ